MFIDYNIFPFLVDIVKNVDAIAKEFNEAEKSIKFISEFKNDENPTVHNHVDYWIRENKFHPEDIGYEARSGVWTAFPIYKIGFPIKWYDVKNTFPTVLNHLKKVPGVYFSSFMRLDSTAKTTPHKHLMKNLIFHVLLHDLDAPCVFTVGGKEKALQYKGDALLFDYSQEHGSTNNSSLTRITFTIDFDPRLFLNDF